MKFYFLFSTQPCSLLVVLSKYNMLKSGKAEFFRTINCLWQQPQTKIRGRLSLGRVQKAEHIHCRLMKPKTTRQFSANRKTGDDELSPSRYDDDANVKQRRRDDKDRTQSVSHKRVWAAGNSTPSSWEDRVIDSTESLSTLAARISHQDFLENSRLESTQLGVLHEDPIIDVELMSKNYTLPALAGALRDREDALQQVATLAEKEEWQAITELLQNFHPKNVKERRQRKNFFSLTETLDEDGLHLIRKALMRMPRTMPQAHSKRAGVAIPLCLVNGVPSLLLEKRAPGMRAHPDEICLPGGMVCDVNDTTIVATCLREMKEEIRGLEDSVEDSNIQVLGVFRCNWGEVHNLVGVAVTPVVCFLGELPTNLHPNPDEVANVFTIPAVSLLDKSLWVHKEGLAPIFLGGPEVIWGLTGYILYKFAQDILRPNSAV